MLTKIWVNSSEGHDLGRKTLDQSGEEVIAL